MTAREHVAALPHHEAAFSTENMHRQRTGSGCSSGSRATTPASLGADILGSRGNAAVCEVKTLTEETDDSFGVPDERFVLRELLGEGSFGAVYRCSMEGPTGTVGEYAVKVINAMRISTLVGYPLELVCPRLKREVEILKHLGEHPRILKLHFAFYSDKTHRFYVVTELLKGGELFQAIIRRRKPFNETEGRVIFAQLVDAVIFCHSMGVAHRDLKLENCLFETTESLNVKLCDYGQAKLLSGQGFTETAKTLTTTPAYTAPEVAHAVQTERPYDAFKADSFGLGVILYGLLCSALPDAAKGAQYERHRRWHELSEEVRDLIRRLLAPDPAQRLSPHEVRNHCWLCGGPNGGSEGTILPHGETGHLEAATQEARCSTPAEHRLPVEAALAAQQVVVAVQRERGTCCWALGSAEGEASFRWQVQYSDERFQDAKRAIGLILSEGDELQESRWGHLLEALKTAEGELAKLRKHCTDSLQHRDETLDSEEDFSEAYAAYCTLIYKVIAAVVATMPKLRGGSSAPTRLELRHRLLQYTAEQLGRERAFLTGHLSRPETLRLFAVVMQLAEIIGARKMLLGSCSSSKKQGTIVASDTGLLPALKLMEAPPVDPEELSMLESVEQRAMNSRKVDPPAVTEWWCQLTKVIDKIHQHIMVNVVEFFSQSASSASEFGG